MKVFRHRLPHFYAPGTPLFITFRLHGSLPPERHFTQASLTAGQAFVYFDQLLDRAGTGPVYLKMPEIAATVAEAIEVPNGQTYTLHSWVIMPNHVHLLMTPLSDPSLILRKLKGSTARKANLILGVKGGPFWQHESYDRLVRNTLEFKRIENYIFQNPVKAGLVASPEQYRWSSAWAKGELKPAAS